MTILSPRTIARCVALAVTAALPFLSLGNELEDLIKEGKETNPAILAAKWQVEQALLKHEELDEFFDPSFYAALGKADNSRSVPGATNFTRLTNNSFDAQLGIEVPIQPGAYVSLGAARRILQDEDDYGDLYQTLFGVQVRIPLLRDRAFKALSLDRALAMAEYNAAVSKLLSETQLVRRDIELAYISAYESLSNYRVAQEATQRFLALHKETQELSKLKVVPDYQIFQSKQELQKGMEDEEKARDSFEQSLLTLARKVGIERKLALAGDRQALLDSATLAKDLLVVPLEEACLSRGTYLVLQNNIQYARLQQDKAVEETQDNLNLYFSMTAQGEDENNIFAMNELVTDRRVGGDVSIVWKRSIDYRGPKARQARYGAYMKELQEQLRETQLDIRTAMQSAEMNFRAALNRLELVNQGIEAARNNLASEQERFRLGENTSTTVTDAQKNLTTILQRQTTATADLLRARANYLYAIGYHELPPPAAEK